MNIAYTETGISEFSRIEHLWIKLNNIHAASSPFFSDEYADKKFCERKDEFLEKSKSGVLKVFLAEDPCTQSVIGYCVCSVVQHVGEIDCDFCRGCLPHASYWKYVF